MKKTGKRVKFIAALVLAGVSACFCQSKVYALNDSPKVNVSLLGKYDSADTASIRSVDLDEKKIRFRNHDTGRTYTLTYDNTSMMYDMYGKVLSPGLLEQGQIVDVTFLKSTKHITTLNVSKDAWMIDSTRRHELVRNDGTAIVKDSVYKLDSRALVLAEDQPALPEDVLSTDSVCVRGIGKDIYSVVVTGGHGYVSLSSDTVEDHSLVGAWIELDNEVIYKISPNMMLSAPEGDYKLQILGNGANYQSQVNVARNQETVVDTSNITIEKPKEGLVQFDIIPDTAEVFVDGKRMLTGVPQSIQYGYHNLKIMAEGYISQSKYLKVGTPNSVIQIELEKDEDSSASSSTSSDSDAATLKSVKDNSTDNSTKEATSEKKDTISSNSADTGSSKKVSENSSDERVNKLVEGYKIYFDEPNGVEVYFDGSYVGIIPTNVNKITGTHEVILKKKGYQTKSYRISIDADKSDLSYKFPELIKNKKDDSESGSSASTSSTSASTEDSSDSGSSSDSGTSEDSGSSASSDDSASSTSDTSGFSGTTDKGTGADSTSEEASDAANTASGEN